MATNRINVLIYSGPGTSLNSVRQATWSLRRLLGPNYAILSVTADQILQEPWTASCALLVMPGGADASYCKTLNGLGNRRIKQYVQLGGKYLGFCAGGYYGSARCEFELGRTGWEVVGERELAFFRGTCRGLAFPGFVYASEQGARAVSLKINHQALPGETADSFRSYYNGGGVFVGSPNDNTEVLARYEDDLAVDAAGARAAVVFCKVGDGAAILTGPHPEFSGINLNRNEPSNPDYAVLVDALRDDDEKRTGFMKACLTRLGLEVSLASQAVPSLSRLHLSSAQPNLIAELTQSWRGAGIVTVEDNDEYIKGENDSFLLDQTDRWKMDSLVQAVHDVLPRPVKNAVAAATSTLSHEDALQADASLSSRTAAPDSDHKFAVRLVSHETSLPDPKETPQFNHHAFYSNLRHYQAQHRTLSGDFGHTLLYGEVVTSTNTLLEKNFTLLSQLPNGTTFTATTQIAGRGRGNNVWVSPPGTLALSVVLRHSLNGAPVVFVQYLAAMATIAGIKGYDKGYEKMPVKLKWPNDVYASVGETSSGTQTADTSSHVKVGGILINTSYSGTEYTLVVGIGLNARNAAPTTSLSLLAARLSLPPFQLEKLLASILVHFEDLYARFSHARRFDVWFEQQYYRDWLHSGQIVTLETEGGVKAKILGITTDWGLLLAEEVREYGDGQVVGTGRRFALQSDSNSFDFFRGLIKRKL